MRSSVSEKSHSYVIRVGENVTDICADGIINPSSFQISARTAVELLCDSFKLYCEFDDNLF